MSLDQQALQLRHLPPCSGAGQVLRFVDTVDVQRHHLGAGPSTFVAEILIIKFFGIAFGLISSMSPDSRVGSQ